MLREDLLYLRDNIDIEMSNLQIKKEEVDKFYLQENREFTDGDRVVGIKYNEPPSKEVKETLVYVTSAYVDDNGYIRYNFSLNSPESGRSDEPYHFMFDKLKYHR